MIKLDLLTIIKNVADKVVLWGVPCIKRAFTFQNNSGETILKTDGINIIVSEGFILITTSYVIINLYCFLYFLFLYNIGDVQIR